MSGSGGPEAAAIQVLTRAVQLDGEKKFSEALTCYEQGIRLLLQASRGICFFDFEIIVVVVVVVVVVVFMNGNTERAKCALSRVCIP